jgi:hypothetical protein
MLPRLKMLTPNSAALARSAYGTPGVAEAVEGLRARHLVDEVQVDVEQVGLTLGTAHDVRVPDLLGQCLRHASAPRSTLIRAFRTRTCHLVW